MATAPTQIRIDSDVKNQTEVPEYNQNVLEAMDEARKISDDSDIKGYTNMDDLIKALDE